MARDGRRDRRTLLARGSALLIAAACASRTEEPAAGRPAHHGPEGFRNPAGSPERGGGFGEWADFFWRRLGRPADPPPLPAGHTPEEAVTIGRAVGARRLGTMHWGTVVLTDEPPFEPPDRFRSAAAVAGYEPGRSALVPAIGEALPIG